MGGAIFNATLSVDVKELDYMDGITITDPSTTLNNSEKEIDRLFGFETDALGNIIQKVDSSANLGEEEILLQANKAIQKKREIVSKIRDSNPDTKLEDKELMDMYDDLNNEGFIIM